MKRLQFDEVTPEMVVEAVDPDATRVGEVVDMGNDSFQIKLIVGGHPTDKKAEITRADMESAEVRVFDAMS